MTMMDKEGLFINRRKSQSVTEQTMRILPDLTSSLVSSSNVTSWSSLHSQLQISESLSECTSFFALLQLNRGMVLSLKEERVGSFFLGSPSFPFDIKWMKERRQGKDKVSLDTN
jgi:hypothetical protein